MMALLSKSTTSLGVQIEKDLPAPFIVGMGRSGTTLLRLMLDAHPDLAIPPETHFIPSVASACKESSNPSEAFINTLVSSPFWEDQHVNIELLRKRITSMEPFNLGDGLRAFYKLYAEKFGKPRWGDKSAYRSVMVLIQELIPEARFVHIIRDGRDVALSIINLWWGPNSVEESANWWVSGIQEARSQVADLHWYLEIRYEDLVLDTESILKKICSFIDLPWNVKMLDYHKQAGERMAELTSIMDPNAKRITSVEERLSIHRNLTSPPKATHVGGWRTKMTSSDLETFKRIAGDLLLEIGYEAA